MTTRTCPLVDNPDKERSVSRIKGALNGRGGKKGVDLLCGFCSQVLMSKAPNRPVELLVRCYDCDRINDLSG